MQKCSGRSKKKTGKEKKGYNIREMQLLMGGVIGAFLPVADRGMKGGIATNGVTSQIRTVAHSRS